MQHRIQLSNILLMAIKGSNKKIQPLAKMSLSKGIAANMVKGNIKYKPRHNSFDISGVTIREKAEELVF